MLTTPEDFRRSAARRSSSAPDDPRACLEALRARARVEGRAVFLEALSTREEWKRSPPIVQDLAIAEVDRRLSPAFEHLHTRRYTCAPLSHRIAAFRHRATAAELMLIPAGSSTIQPWPDQPPRVVRAPHPFLLGRYPLLQSEWDRPSHGALDERERHGPDLPIGGVTWNAAQAWLAAAGDGLCLPALGVWEYACSAGSSSKFYWGEDMDFSHCWPLRPEAPGAPAPTPGAARCNAFGLVGMIGDVLEWCGADSTDSGDARPVRGAWSTTLGLTPDYAPYRGRLMRDSSLPSLGFRLARIIGY